LLNKLIFKTGVLVAFLIFVLAASLMAQTTGKIAGMVKDKDTGEPLPGVNILIKGTTMGAATNPQGEYFITNVPVGTYILLGTMLGYVPVEFENVKVSVDLTTTIDFELTTQAIELGKVITVTAERPLVIKDQTSSIRIVTNEEITSLPTRGYQQVASLQAGVVEDANRNIYIRGGRANEINWVIDGFSQKDPLTGLSTTAINQNAIEEVEVVTGGFNAQYGNAMSGAVNVVTKEGGIKYTGQAEAVTDNLAGGWIGAEKYDYNIYALSFGGPLFPKSEKHTFFVSGEKRWQRDRFPRATAEGPLPNNSVDGWTWQGKFNFKLTDALKLQLGSLGSFDRWREYLNTYRYNASHMPQYDDLNHSFWAKLNHAINKSIFYNLGIQYYMTQRVVGDGIYFDDLRSYARAVLNPRYDPEALYWSGDDPSTSLSGVSISIDTTYEDPDTLVDTTYTYYGTTPFNYHGVTYNVVKGGTDHGYGDEGHVYGDFLKRNSKYLGLNLDFTDQVNTNHQLRFGGSFEYHTLRRYHHLMAYKIFSTSVEDSAAWFQDVDSYGYEYNLATNEFSNSDKGLDGAKHPKIAALYIQDKIEYQGAVINAGVRYDYLNTDTDALKNESRPLDPNNRGALDPLSAVLDPGDLEKSKAYHKVSPRVGVGFPITDRTLFHVSYGMFFQTPNLEDLYVSYKYLEYKVKTGGYYFAFGNPNLKPEQTIAYEVGFTHQLSNNSKFDLTAFYKDVKDLIEVQNIPSYPKNFASFRNADYGTIKGLDFSLTLRRTKGISANVNYTLSYATGTGSASNTQRNIAWTVDRIPKMTSPLDFDQRHKLVLNLDVRAKKGEGPVWGNIRPLENAGINLIFNANSGKPYTPTKVYNEVTLAAISIENPGKINSRYGPWTYRLDLKADKSFYYRNLGIEFYVWVLNLFDRDNALTVFTGSGSPNTTGWLATPEGQAWLQTYGEAGLKKYLEAEGDPTCYGVPRMIRFGMILSF
jgi:outer membrane receptor protein involved in Fe transport